MNKAMNKILRGKALQIMKPTTEYAKVPLAVLTHPKLTAIDKIIIAYLYSHSDSGRYILAYTRIAKELNIDKSHLIKRWKWLKENGYIIEDATKYYITVGTLKTEVDGSDQTEKKDGSLKPLEIKDGLVKPTKDGSLNPHACDSLIQPEKVGLTCLNGSSTPPNEHNKEEKEELNIKKEHIFSSESSLSENQISKIEIKKVEEPQLDNSIKMSFEEYAKIHTLSNIQKENRIMHECYVEKKDEATIINYKLIYTTQYWFNFLLNINRRLTINEVEQIRRDFYIKSSFPDDNDVIKNNGNQEEDISVQDLKEVNIRQISEEIGNYSSNFFEEENYSLVTDLYIQFKMRFPKTKIILDNFEKVLFFWLSACICNDDKLLKEFTINQYFKMNSNIDINVIQVVINEINKHPEIQESYKYTLDNYKLKNSENLTPKSSKDGMDF